MGQSSQSSVWSDFPVVRYHRRSRRLISSLVMVIPLFVLYQIGVLTTGGVRNGADFMTDLMWLAAGGELEYYLWINVGLLVGFVVAALVLIRRGGFEVRLWPWVIVESSVYAFFLGAVVLQIMEFLGAGAALNTAGSQYDTIFEVLILSIGAGLYEELVFRLLIMGGLFWLLSRLFRWPSWMAAVAAVMISSLAFSAVHHLGALGDPFSPEVFIFRFVAGVVLAVLFYLRGFAVAVYTHAIYDVLVLLS